MEVSPVIPQRKQRCLPPWMTIINQYKEANIENAAQVESSKCGVRRYIEESLPYLQFPGRIFCHENIGDATLACDSILEKGDCVVGFDMEWDVLYTPGVQQPRTALVQLCTDGEECHLFHIASMFKFPPALRLLLEQPKIKKVGLGIKCDFLKLERDFGFPVQPIIETSTIDLGKMAGIVLRKPSEKWSLDGLVKHMLDCKLDKSPSVRCSRWSRWPLSKMHKTYAATDAYASWLVYHELKRVQIKSEAQHQNGMIAKIK